MRTLSSALSLALVATPAVAQTAGAYLSFGEGCPDSSLLYEQFAPGTFDLSGTPSLDWIPNGQLGYVVLRGISSYLPPTGGTNLNLTDESISPPQSLGFTFSYPTGAGAATQIQVCSNGYVYLEPGTITSTRCCDGSGKIVWEFREQTPSWAVFGTDLDPRAGGNVWFNTTPGGAFVTWDQVPEKGSMTPVTCQIQLYSNGQVTLVWPSAAAPTQSTLVGWSGGGGVDDDGPFDFSASPVFNMGPSSGPLTASAPVTRPPTIGKPFQIDFRNVPSDAFTGALMFANGTTSLALDSYGMAGCSLYVTQQITAVPVALTPPTGQLAFQVPFVPFFAGTSLETQAAVVAPSVNLLGVSTSNRGTLRIGDVDPLIVRAVGADNEVVDPNQAFWQVINSTPLNIVSVRFDWLRSTVPNSLYFDTNQTGLADRFDGGNSQTPLCKGTYRNGSDALTGLDYSGTQVSPCAGGATTGWVGSGFGRAAGDYRTLDFAFLHFQPGETFEFDADTDGGPGNGGAMAGLLVTVKMSDGTVRSGQLVMVDFLTAEAGL